MAEEVSVPVYYYVDGDILRPTLDASEAVMADRFVKAQLEYLLEDNDTVFRPGDTVDQQLDPQFSPAEGFTFLSRKRCTKTVEIPELSARLGHRFTTQLPEYQICSAPMFSDLSLIRDRLESVRTLCSTYGRVTLKSMYRPDWSSMRAELASIGVYPTHVYPYELVHDPQSAEKRLNAAARRDAAAKRKSQREADYKLAPLRKILEGRASLQQAFSVLLAPMVSCLSHVGPLKRSPLAAPNTRYTTSMNAVYKATEAVRRLSSRKVDLLGILLLVDMRKMVAKRYQKQLEFRLVIHAPEFDPLKVIEVYRRQYRHVKCLARVFRELKRFYAQATIEFCDSY